MKAALISLVVVLSLGAVSCNDYYAYTGDRPYDIWGTYRGETDFDSGFGYGYACPVCGSYGCDGHRVMPRRQSYDLEKRETLRRPGSGAGRWNRPR